MNFQSDEKTARDARRRVWQSTHLAVSMLWSVPKRTTHHMSFQLVTDHIKSVKTDFRLTELQLITKEQNVVEDRGTTFAEGLQPIKPAHVADGETAAAGTV